MRLAINSGIVTGDAPISYWLIFLLSPVTAAEFFAKVNSAQFPPRVLSGELFSTHNSNPAKKARKGDEHSRLFISFLQESLKVLSARGRLNATVSAHSSVGTVAPVFATQLMGTGV